MPPHRNLWNQYNLDHLLPCLPGEELADDLTDRFLAAGESGVHPFKYIP